MLYSFTWSRVVAELSAGGSNSPALHQPVRTPLRQLIPDSATACWNASATPRSQVSLFILRLHRLRSSRGCLDLPALSSP